MTFRARLKAESGASATESLLVVVLLILLGGVVSHHLLFAADEARAVAATANVAALRDAVNMYTIDHGWPPCSPRDYNRHGDPDLLARQLTSFTSARGEPNEQGSPEFCFGPYLEEIPRETMGKSARFEVDLDNERTHRALTEAVSRGDGAGGWYYEARSGIVVANVGQAHLADGKP